jgi:hypothetical protein
VIISTCQNEDWKVWIYINQNASKQSVWFPIHGNHEESTTTYDNVNSDGSQSVRGIQSLTLRKKL